MTDKVANAEAAGGQNPRRCWTHVAAPAPNKSLEFFALGHGRVARGRGGEPSWGPYLERLLQFRVPDGKDQLRALSE